jgi:hypothetical protein
MNKWLLSGRHSYPTLFDFENVINIRILPVTAADTKQKNALNFILLLLEKALLQAERPIIICLDKTEDLALNPELCEEFNQAAITLIKKIKPKIRAQLIGCISHTNNDIRSSTISSILCELAETSVTQYYFEGNFLSEDLNSFFQTNRNIHAIDCVGAEGIDLISALKDHQELEQIAVANNVNPLAMHSFINEHPNLRYLRLPWKALTTQTATSIKNASITTLLLMPHLHTLISSETLTAISYQNYPVEPITDILQSTTIKLLALENIALSDKHFLSLIDALKNNKTLEKLRITEFSRVHTAYTDRYNKVFGLKISSTTYQTLFQALTGHSSLKELAIFNYNFTLTEQELTSVAAFINSTPNLRCIALSPLSLTARLLRLELSDISFPSDQGNHAYYAAIDNKTREAIRFMFHTLLNLRPFLHINSGFVKAECSNTLFCNGETEIRFHEIKNYLPTIIALGEKHGMHWQQKLEKPHDDWELEELTKLANFKNQVTLNTFLALLDMYKIQIAERSKLNFIQYMYYPNASFSQRLCKDLPTLLSLVFDSNDCMSVILSKLYQPTSPALAKVLPYLRSAWGIKSHGFFNGKKLTGVSVAMETLLETAGYTYENVPGDGNCFFSAILLQLQHLNIHFEGSADTLRQNCIDHILKNYTSKYQSFIINSNQFFADNIKSGAWADHVMIDAAAAVLNVRIKIMRSDYQTNYINSFAADEPEITLGYQVGLHYVSVVENHAKLNQVTLDKRKTSGNDNNNKRPRL